MTYIGKIELNFEHKSEYSLIYSKGTRSTFGESVAVAEKIADAMQQSTHKRLLLDYRDAYYDIPNSDAYNLIKVFEIKLTDYKSYTMAVVVNKQNAEFGKLWASIGRKRGFNFAVFSDFDEAESWVKKQ